MKKILSVSLILVLTFGFITPLFAAENPGEKLSRGAANVISCPLEIPKQIDIEWKASDNAAIGIVTGLFKGLAFGVGRLCSGLYDVITFPANIPKEYEPLMKPDYVFED